MSESTEDSQATEKLLDQIRTRFSEADEAEREIRREAKQDLRFLGGDQWPEGAKRERERNDRPCLTINRLPTFVRQVVNQGRQNKPQIHISPVDSGADKDTAAVISGLVRHIEYDSDADAAYDSARQYATACGFGAFRVLTDYSSEETFDQDIKIEAIPDPFSVYCDPHARRADRSDARFMFVVEWLSKDEYKQRWPDSEVVSRGFADDRAAGWINENSVQVAEYWYVETKRKKLLYLSTGETVFEGDKESREQLQARGVTVEKEREVLKRQVRCITTNGAEVLKEQDWAGQWIPIILVFGEELIIDGKRKLFSLVRFARDPQQLYNYHKTMQAEALQVAPKAPFIGAVGQFEGHEDEWASANQVNYAFLQYNLTDADGKTAPPPQRNAYEPPIQALSISAMQAADDIKATTGIFDPSIGDKSNETSGLAIQRRQAQSDTSNFHFEDNFSRAQKYCGRIILDLIPKIYDTDRTIRIIGEDDAERVVRVNAQYEDEEGKQRHYAFGPGKYDVRISTGPTYATRRQEAFSMLTEFGRVWPNLVEIGGDIIFRNSDVPGADELAERLKRTLPPELVADDEKGPAKIPPQAKAQMDALAKQHEALTAQLNEAQELLQGKRLELESKERIEALKIQAQLAITQAKLDSEDGREAFRQELTLLRQEVTDRLDMLRADEPVTEEPKPAERVSEPLARAA